MFEQSPPISEVDVLESPDVVAAELATSLPRAEDMSALLMLDTETLSDAGRVDLLVAFERHIALLQAAQQQAVSAADPRRAEQRHDDAVAQRRVVFTQQDDGITELWALLPADGAALIEAVLNSLGSAQTDSRTGDQRGADALVDVFARVLGDPSLPEAHGQRPAINVTVQLSTLLGCNEQPAHLDGYGAITADMARRLAADESGTWRRLVTDDTQLLDYGRKTYRPPVNLTDHVIARDKTCTFPGCRRTARLCDLDHVEAWTDGGGTNHDNVAALCARHHNAKHDAGWRFKPRPDGTREWASPTGHRYVVHTPD